MKNCLTKKEITNLFTTLTEQVLRDELAQNNNFYLGGGVVIIHQHRKL